MEVFGVGKIRNHLYRLRRFKALEHDYLVYIVIDETKQIRL